VTATRASTVAGLVTVTAWGSAFVGIRAAGEALSPGPLALGRLIVSTAVLGAIALSRRDPLPGRRDLGAIALYGVLWLTIYSIALNAAEQRVDAGTAAMIINTGPILIAILAGFLLHEGFPPRLFAGCAVAFGGCMIIGLASSRSGPDAGLGLLLLTIAAVAYALAVIVQKSVLARVTAFQVTWLGCAAATIACLPFAPGLAAEAAHAGSTAIGWTVYLGLVPTALGFVTWNFALRRATAGQMASLTYLIPVVAILLGWALLGETPPLIAVAGGALCLIGVSIASRRSRAQERERGGRSADRFGGVGDDPLA